MEVYKECIRVGAGQWPEGATTRRRVAATHDALLFAQREVSSFAICTKHSIAQCTKLFLTHGAFLFAQSTELCEKPFSFYKDTRHAAKKYQDF